MINHNDCKKSNYRVKGTEKKKEIMKSLLNFLSEEDHKGRDISHQAQTGHQKQQHSCNSFGRFISNINCTT